MNKSKLKKIYATPKGKLVLDCLSTYKRNVSETQAFNIAQAIGKREIKEWEVRQILRELSACGVGEFIVGKKGYFSRIAWSVPVTAVAAAVGANANGATAHVEEKGADVVLTVRNLTAKQAKAVGVFISTLAP